MRECKYPGLPEVQRYQMPVVAVVSEKCGKYAPGKPIEAA